MKKLIIVMDSCKEYVVRTDDAEAFIDRFYNHNSVPSAFGQTNNFCTIRNRIDRLDEHVYINPSHISSLEIMDE